ncbi:MAG: DUF4990 domain-containing protein [Bacteroidales bacterium]|jgi:hypothetical protein|nr:DUF4990 domain-containing protein [Bacteroidales bacterium]
MKHFSLLVSLFLAAACTLADNLKESFESGLPSSASSAETTVALASGDWKVKGVYAKKDNGSMRATMSGGGYVITPSLNQPGNVSFKHRASGNGKKLLVEKSTDGGATWSEIGTATISSSSNYGSSSFKVNSDEDDTAVQIRFTCQSATIYLDDIDISLNSASANTTDDETPDPTYITEGIPVPTRPFPTPLHEYFIAPNGNDVTGDGSFEKPWLNLQYAVDHAVAGDHIVCRGGTYTPTYKKDGEKYTVRITTSGTADAPIVIRNYENELPIFDFKQQLLDNSIGDRGILLTGNHWWLYGLHITHAADNGIKLEGSYNRIERCQFSYNLDTGLQLGFGHDFSATGFGSKNDGTYCAYNDIIDCDSYYNCDYDSNYGSDADGFACKMHNGKGNRFIRCRAWHNSDDAWDLYETDFSVVLVECWAWESGKAADHTWVKDYVTKGGSMSFSGNGNGIKLGGNGTGGSSRGIHYAINCISFGNNNGSSVKGFDCNSHKEGHVLIGCLGFDNSYDFMFESGGSSADTYFCNNICLGRQEICVGGDDWNAIASAMSKNGWTNHLVTGIGREDFISLDEEEALKPRAVDGSLPRKFGRLAADSKLIDAGDASYESACDVYRQLVADFPFLARTVTGQSRDIGPYERPASDDVSEIRVVKSSDKKKAAKAIRNGQFVIERDGLTMNAIGQKMK